MTSTDAPFDRTDELAARPLTEDAGGAVTIITVPSTAADLDAWLKNAEVCKAANISKSGYYKAVAAGRAPGPDIKQGSRFARWKTSTVAAWMRDPAGWAERNRARLERGSDVQ